jgi:hypothetical protein
VEQRQQNKRFGSYHSSYPKVVVPSKIMCVPEVRPVRSKVVPDGTATLERTIVAQDVLDLLAREAPADLEKVHETLWQDLGLLLELEKVRQQEQQLQARW